jgi:hypothetical protein
VSQLSPTLHIRLIDGEKKRADERTRTADLISLRAISQALQGFADGCKSRKSKPYSILCFAPCCIVLRSRWCQNARGLGDASSFANQIRRVKFRGGGVPNVLGMGVPPHEEVIVALLGHVAL